MLSNFKLRGFSQFHEIVLFFSYRNSDIESTSGNSHQHLPKFKSPTFFGVQIKNISLVTLEGMATEIHLRFWVKINSRVEHLFGVQIRRNP